jgi:lysozyme
VSSTKLLSLIKRVEGCSLVPYVCPAGFWTIGYGHLCTSSQTPITQEQADETLGRDVETAVRQVLVLSPGLEGGKLDAITDFVFNLGRGRYAASTLRRCVNAGDDVRVATELRRWVHGGGRVLPGLVARREVEVKLWLTYPQKS